MTTFDDRERAQEAKFARDEELNFKAEARRNRLLGEWAAGLLGKTGDDARAYALTIVSSDFDEPGDEDVYRKLSADLAGKVDEQTIRSQMVALRATARNQIVDES
ncbi:MULTISPECIES: DUF1476 domain-containing protein [Paracoccus]|uniref:DUF1476 domain-containing protein n=1 Tax=Paracoccus TaxID=265 RepID=UPI000374C45F|nr:MULTISPECIES: DUF1476 domain-containing protein [Paracoccus]MDQ7775451.1 DUF1476 domain-containing protein [Paracoccus aminovorans]